MEQAPLTIQQQKGDSQGQIILVVQGKLTLEAIAPYWNWLNKLVCRYHNDHIQLDLAGLTGLDSAGEELINMMRQHMQQGSKLELINIPTHFQGRLAHSANADIVERSCDPCSSVGISRWSFVTRLGHAVIDWLHQLYIDISFLGQFIASFGRWLQQPFMVRRGDFFRILSDVGPGALPIILLLGFLMGLILSFQSAIPLQRFGAQSYVPNMVGLSLTRELGPLMVAIVLAGRTASAFAAELGTMKVNQELDALKTMGIPPFVHLIIPRFLAATIMAPLLNLFMVAVAFIGCAVFMKMAGYSLTMVEGQLQYAVQFKDLIGGLFKSLVFGMIIGLLGCKHGMQTGGGASAVGQATTRAVVSSIVWFVILDGVFSIAYYVLGL